MKIKKCGHGFQKHAVFLQHFEEIHAPKIILKRLYFSAFHAHFRDFDAAFCFLAKKYEKRL